MSLATDGWRRRTGSEFCLTRRSEEFSGRRFACEGKFRATHEKASNATAPLFIIPDVSGLLDRLAQQCVFSLNLAALRSGLFHFTTSDDERRRCGHGYC
jgi:hypothetical protein